MTGWVASAVALGVLLQTAPPSVSALDAIDQDISAGVYGNVDRLYVMRKGEVIADHNYPRDYRAISRGRVGPIGCGDGCADANWKHEFNYFHPDSHPFYKGRDIHTLQSVTKSIAATVIGIALGRGEIRSLDQPFLEHFADKDLSRIDPRLRTATIADLLTMRSGIEWHEQDRPLGDTNTTIQLERSRDWIQFTLDQPMDAAPGASGCTTAAAASCCRASSAMRPGASSTTTRANTCSRRLASPISTGRKPRPAILTPKVACISRPPASRASVSCIVATVSGTANESCRSAGCSRRRRVRSRNVAPGWDYGYQWWITSQNGVDVWAGRGFGGQLLLVIPARDTVAVVVRVERFRHAGAKPRPAAHRGAHRRAVRAAKMLESPKMIRSCSSCSNVVS